MLFGTKPAESQRLQLPIWGNRLRSCDVPALLRLTAGTHQDATQKEKQQSARNRPRSCETRSAACTDHYLSGSGARRPGSPTIEEDFADPSYAGEHIIDRLTTSTD